jgi:hypothetical protein
MCAQQNFDFIQIKDCNKYYNHECKLIHESFLLFIVSLKYCNSCENIFLKIFNYQ